MCDKERFMKNYYVFVIKNIDGVIHATTLQFDDYNHVLIYLKVLLEDETVLNFNVEWELI